MKASTAVTVYDSCDNDDSVVVKRNGRNVHVTAKQGSRQVVVYLNRLATLELIAALADAAT